MVKPRKITVRCIYLRFLNDVFRVSDRFNSFWRVLFGLAGRCVHHIVFWPLNFPTAGTFSKKGSVSQPIDWCIFRTEQNERAAYFPVARTDRFATYVRYERPTNFVHRPQKLSRNFTHGKRFTTTLLINSQIHRWPRRDLSPRRPLK